MWNKIKRIVSRGFGKISAIVFFLIATLIFFSVYWSNEPAQLSPLELAGDAEDAGENSGFIGSASIAALINVAETLLTKPGGFLSNDIMPPGVYLDNIPNWEFGVLVQVRDFSRAFREGFSRSQSQSTEENQQKVISNLYWELPKGWIPSKGHSMRLASFDVPFSSGVGDLSIVSLSGISGGLLANVNRWRGQINLDPISENQILEVSEVGESKMGAFRIFKMVNKLNKENEENTNSFNHETKLSDEIDKLNKLLEDGVLTQEEFEKAKKKLLDN